MHVDGHVQFTPPADCCRTVLVGTCVCMGLCVCALYVCGLVVLCATKFCKGVNRSSMCVCVSIFCLYANLVCDCVLQLGVGILSSGLLEGGEMHLSGICSSSWQHGHLLAIYVHQAACVATVIPLLRLRHVLGWQCGCAGEHLCTTMMCITVKVLGCLLYSGQCQSLPGRCWQCGQALVFVCTHASCGGNFLL